MARFRVVAIWLLLVCAFLALTFALDDDLPARAEGRDVLLADAAGGRISEVRVSEEAVVVTLTNGEAYTLLGYLDDTAYDALTTADVSIAYDSGGGLAGMVTWVVPVVLVLAFLFFFLRRMQQGAGGGNLFAMRRSTARLVKPGAETLRFTDVGGAAEAKERLGDVVDYLKNPKRWTDGGVRIPRGVLLEGPPGCGKTLLARAVAGEAGVPVFVVSASEFVEMFVGVGAARIRDLFDTAAKNAPAVVFIDELDAVGRRRGSGVGASHDEREQTLNQLLVNLDGFEKVPRVVVIAATNRLDVLDSALLRPGRFDVRVSIPPPDEEARREILRVHLRGKPVSAEVSVDDLAARTAGLTGADLEHLCNEAAIAAVRRARGGAPLSSEVADFDAVLARRAAQTAAFDRVDQLLLESASQLARPVGPTHVHLTLLDDAVLEGALLWADATFLKIRLGDGLTTRIVPKAQIKGLHALSGTGEVAGDEAVGDAWAGRQASLA